MRKHFIAPLVLAGTVGLIAALPAVATAQAGAETPETVAAQDSAAQDSAAANEVIVADQGSGARGQRVSILKQDADWNSPSAEVWSWVPPNRPEWAAGITDAKVRTDAKKRRVVLVSAGSGGVAKIDRDSGEVLWSSTVPPRANAHSIELLPGGQIVVAGSGDGTTGRGGALYFFPATDREHNNHTRPINFLGAHGVVYNDGRLWALGYDSLRQYDIRKQSLVEALPRITTFWAFDAKQGKVKKEKVGHGHDLATIHGTDQHELWITNSRHVYRFNKYKVAEQSPRRLTDGRDDTWVKSVGNQPDGTMLQTRPLETNKGQCAKKFQTPTVSLFDGNGRELPSKTRTGSCFYKARPVVWTYY